ncbi:MAG: hypothetical protein LBR77_07570 [Lachnospiraceae bacterium]|jgi:hypothetical protein|nr:hypothetical protein [Lachnospiraceae bacterium]
MSIKIHPAILAILLATGLSACGIIGPKNNLPENPVMGNKYEITITYAYTFEGEKPADWDEEQSFKCSLEFVSGTDFEYRDSAWGVFLGHYELEGTLLELSFTDVESLKREFREILKEEGIDIEDSSAVLKYFENQPDDEFPFSREMDFTVRNNGERLKSDWGVWDKTD